MGTGYSQPPSAPEPTKKNYTGLIVLVLLGLCCIPIGLIAAILVPVFTKAREAAQLTINISSVKMLATSTMMYMQDFDDRMPPAQAWRAAVEPYSKAAPVEKFPDGRTQSFAFNTVLGGVDRTTIPNPERTPMIFSKTIGAGEEAGGASLFRMPDANLRSAVAFADTSARGFNPSKSDEIARFEWEPKFTPLPKKGK